MTAKNLISTILMLPVCAGGVFLWTTRGATKRSRAWVGVALGYDAIALSIMHWWLKTL
jgi:hypothetical protein